LTGRLSVTAHCLVPCPEPPRRRRRRSPHLVHGRSYGVAGLVRPHPGGELGDPAEDGGERQQVEWGIGPTIPAGQMRGDDESRSGEGVEPQDGRCRYGLQYSPHLVLVYLLLGYVSLLLCWPVPLLSQQRQSPPVLLPADKLSRFFSKGSVKRTLWTRRPRNENGPECALKVHTIRHGVIGMGPVGSTKKTEAP
jgi:hypothetical protein